MTKNNITRLLDSKNIPYILHTLPDHIVSAVDTAQFLNASLQEVYKSIVLVRVRPGKPIVAIIPATAYVDPKKVATIVNEKKVVIPTLQDAEKLTGLKAGGISPLALLNKGFEFILDQTAISYKKIYLSGGQIGLNIYLPVSSLVELIHPKIADVSRMKQ